MIKFIAKYCYIYLFSLTTLAHGQFTIYQDVIHGGVTGAGFSKGLSWGTLGDLNIYIEPNSQIHKAYYICYSMNSPKADSIFFNGNIINIDTTLTAVINGHFNTFANPQRVFCLDVTQLINPNQSNYQVIWDNDINAPINTGYWTSYLVVVYSNYSLPKTAITINLNNQYLHGNETYLINNLLPIDFNYPVGLSMNLDRVGIDGGSFSSDASIISINNINCGQLIGYDTDTNYVFTGTRGDFYYQNNNLYGLGNDSNDPFFGTTHGDGLANINQYLNNVNNFTLNIKHTRYPFIHGGENNSITSFILAYTSPCDTFSVTHTPDTTVCHGAQLPLFVTGGQAYEWTPQVGLSCYDCPNPVFSADSTMHYSIRIWNNDSCSKVLPLHIVVEEALPHFDFDITPSECGDSTGSITITPALSGFSYINQTTQDTNTTGFFSGLESGFYPISIVNNSACSFDTVVFVPETLSVHADFIASPNAGISPLPVAFNNTSSHANSYQWIYENQSSTQENISHIFQQDGIYPVMLIAYGNTILCADTAYDTIYVYLPIEVEIPNIFTPNSDQNNDQWGIKINVLAEVDIQIFNRWGEVVLNKKQDATAPGFIALWDGAKHAGGVYYYVLRLKTDFEKKEFKGNLTLVR